MKRLRPAQLLSWLLVAICPPLLSRCGRAVEHGADNASESAGDGSSAGTSSTPQTRAGAADWNIGGSSTDVANDIPINPQADLERANACNSLEYTLSQEVADGYAAASTSCQVDDDCTTAGDVGCYHSCSEWIVSGAGGEAAQQALLQDMAPLCDELTQRGCGPLGIPSCPAVVRSIACNDGTCGLRSCEGLVSQLRENIDRIAQNTPKQCTSDDDCILVSTSVSCIPDCGSDQSVPVGYETQLSRQVQNAGGIVCFELASQKCPPIPAPSCPALLTPSRAACVAGQCAFAAAPDAG